MIDEQPGYSAVPVIRPGSRLGRGDLDIEIATNDRVAGSLGFDNHGNYFSGEWRTRGTLQTRRNLVFGDRFSVTGLYTDEETALADVSYELPLNGNGLRGRLGYTRSEYELGGSFEGLFGQSETVFFELPYALKRSQQTNLTLRPRAELSDLKDESPAAPASTKESDAYPVSLEFNHRDAIGGGGIVYGRLTGVYGRLSGDRGSADANFARVRINATRLQRLPGGVQGMLRVVAQDTRDNLDGSEGISLGGANAVRAYPQGEAGGDTGYYLQAELRYAIGQTGAAPYLFYDAGRSTPYGGEVPVGQNNSSRKLSGAGLGVRYTASPFQLNAAVAWRDEGGEPQSSERNDEPKAWITGSIRF